MKLRATFEGIKFLFDGGGEGLGFVHWVVSFKTYWILANSVLIVLEKFAKLLLKFMNSWAAFITSWSVHLNPMIFPFWLLIVKLEVLLQFAAKNLLLFINWEFNPTINFAMFIFKIPWLFNTFKTDWLILVDAVLLSIFKIGGRHPKEFLSLTEKSLHLWDIALLSPL